MEHFTTEQFERLLEGWERNLDTKPQGLFYDLNLILCQLSIALPFVLYLVRIRRRLPTHREIYTTG
jgi:hypothetical protein